MKIKTTVYIHYVKWLWETEGKYDIFSYQLDDNQCRSYVCKQEIEIDVPENYDPRAQQIVALLNQKQKVIADFQKSVDEINEKISKLQALEYTA